jgi:hypothetical protein
MPRTIPTSYNPHHKRLPADKLRPFTPTIRDAEILEAVRANKYLTLPLILAFFPPDRARTPKHVNTLNPRVVGTNLSRRLAKLFHHGYLDRIRLVLGGELIYALTKKGASFLRTHQPQLPMPSRVAPKDDSSVFFILHSLMTARFHAALTVALRERPTLRLDTFERESLDLKAKWRSAGKSVAVNPDAFLILRDTSEPEGKQRTAYFLEADRGTMPLYRKKNPKKQTDYLSKLRAYAEMHERGAQEQFGIPRSFLLLTVTTTPHRAHQMAMYAANDAKIPERVKRLLYFTSEATYAAHFPNLFARIWRTAEQPDALHALVHPPLPLVSSE